MLKAFDGRTYKPCGIINNLHVELGGKNVTIEFEVIDRPLNYKILILIPWVYAMTAIVSTYFQMITFPHKALSQSLINSPSLPLVLRYL